MMREAARRGHALLACEAARPDAGSAAAAWRRTCARSRSPATPHDWFAAKQAERAVRVALADFDAVLMRKDPPFDSEYFYATHLLEQAEREGARVFNQPARCATTRRSSRSSSSRSSSRRRW